VRLAPLALAVGGALALLNAGCGDVLQTLNSSANDDVLYGLNDPLLIGASPGFGRARRVILARCASCHPNFGDYSESAWQSEGYVIAGSHQQSSVYFRLRGAGGSSANMPPGETLSASEIAAVRDWIDGL
jgi:uncharacterized membrane protein